MTISPLSIGALNNGWLVSLNLVIAAFNLDYPANQVDALPLGIINDGHVVATNWVINQMNIQLDDAGSSLVNLPTVQIVNNGWQSLLTDLIDGYNSGSQPTSLAEA